MARKHAVDELEEVEFNFVIERLINGDTDRQISAAFQEAFPGKTLAKSSLGRWRKTAGEELADRYRLARYQARQLLENLKQEDADKFQVIIGDIDDRLLTATREVIAKDPVKLLQIRLDEEKRRQKDREIDLKREQIELEREKLRGAAVDRPKLAEEFLGALLEYIGSDADGLRWFKKNARHLAEFYANKYAQAEK